MNKVFQKVSLGALVLATSLAARAEGEDPITQMMDAISLTGISTKVVALGLVIVAIALAFKGPTLAKRIINRI